MKLIFHCCLIMTLAIIPLTSFAQRIRIVDTSAPESRLVEPDIVMSPGRVKPSCNTYTGCGLVVIKKPHYQRPKRHRVYHRPCCVMDYCYVPTVTRQCY